MPTTWRSSWRAPRNTSSSTELEYYRTIPSLRDYIIVSHRERRIVVHSRNADGSWVIRVAIARGRVNVESMGAALDVDAVYRESSVAI